MLVYELSEGQTVLFTIIIIIIIVYKVNDGNKLFFVDNSSNYYVTVTIRIDNRY